MHYYFTMKEGKWTLTDTGEKDPRVLYYGAGFTGNILVFSPGRQPPWRLIKPSNPDGFWNINDVEVVASELLAWALVLGG